MNDSILVLVESNEQRFTKLNGNFTDIQSVIEGMDTELMDIWTKVVFSMNLNDLCQKNAINVVNIFSRSLKNT